MIPVNTIYKTTLWLLLVLPLHCNQILAAAPSQEFQRLDKDRNGVLEGKELIGIPAKLFKQLDSNADGKISAAEDERHFGRPNGNFTVTELQYANNINPRQSLDLYHPNKPSKAKLPLIVFIHGGAWRSGSKAAGRQPLEDYVKSGNFICASIGYRLSQEAIWPSQLHDCKAAIRFLYAHADKYHIDPTRTVVLGASAGGHLATMVSVTGNNPKMEGNLGKHLDQHSRVAGGISYYGPTDFQKMDDFPSIIEHDAENSPESQLIGAPIQQVPARTQAANPLTYIDENDPPLICIHGSRDRQVPFNQSTLLYNALESAKVPTALITILDGEHGNFRNPKIKKIEKAFVEHCTSGTRPIPKNTTLPNIPKSTIK